MYKTCVKRGCTPGSNLVNDENGDLLADFHNFLNRWERYYSQLLNVHRASDVRQIEIHTAELLVPDSLFEVEIAVAKIKRYKQPVTDQIPAELIEAGGIILRCKINKLINSLLNKEKFPVHWKESIIVPVHKKDDKTDYSNYRPVPSFSSGLQLRVSFGLLNNQPPLGSHGEVLDSLQCPLHMPNLGDTKFLRVTMSPKRQRHVQFCCHLHHMRG
jgi:hypothetical protein